MEADEARTSKAVPCGLLAGAVATQPIAKGDLLTYASVEPDSSTRIVELRKQQDAWLGY